jgi:hypothetical protein
MKTAELYAEVKVADESEHLDDKTPVYRANLTRGGKSGGGGFRGSFRKGRGGPGYQGKSDNFKGSKAQMECYHCHKPGHLISECRNLKMYNDKHRNNSDTSSSADNSTNWRNNNSSNGNASLVSRIITAKTMNLDQPHFNGGQT